MAEQTTWMHVRGGVFFRRTDDGLVEIGHGPDFNSVAPLAELDAAAWASVVAHVSARGGKGPTYNEALNLHEQA